MTNSQLVAGAFRPLVTAVVTTYQRPNLAQRAVRSVVAQTYRPLEMMVIEDGSDSGIERWLDASDLGDVLYMRLPENRGVAAARNAALYAARGEYIAYCDDDDQWKPRRIEAGVACLAAHDAPSRARLAVVEVGLEAHFPGRDIKAIGHPANRGPLRASLLREGIVSLSSAHLFLTEALRSIGGYDEALRSSLDDDLWLAFARDGWGADYVDEGLVVTEEDPGRPRLTGNPRQRMDNVDAFLRKWHTTLAEWLGPEEAQAYAARYYSRVVSNLAGNRLVAGDWTGARAAAAAVLRRAPSCRYGARQVARAMARVGAYRDLPDPLLRAARRLGR